MKASYRNWLICSDLASPLNIVFRAAGVMRVFGVDCIKKFYVVRFLLKFIRARFFKSEYNTSVTAMAVAVTAPNSDKVENKFIYCIFFVRNIKFCCKWQCCSAH